MLFHIKPEFLSVSPLEGEITVSADESAKIIGTIDGRLMPILNAWRRF
jgi:hypothetical protein